MKLNINILSQKVEFCFINFESFRYFPLIKNIQHYE